MEQRRIGSLEVSVVGLGCNNFGWRIDEEASAAVVGAALDAGVTFFDTADIYGRTKSEEFLGRALRGRRREVIIATKFANRVDDERRGASPAYVRRAVEDSLRRLGTDYIDLYQQHVVDPSVPIADTLGALNELVGAGKVREIGCSNFGARELDEAARAVRPGAARFASVQNEYSLLHREPELAVLPACARLGLAFLPYFPLASGLLTGKVVGGKAPPGSRLADTPRLAASLSERTLGVVDALAAYATSRGHTLLELAFAWLLAHPPVASVIAGATTPAQVRANAQAAGWVLSGPELAAVERLAPPPDAP